MKQVTLLLLWALVSITGYVRAEVESNILFSADFEPPLYLTGTLSGQYDWVKTEEWWSSDPTEWLIDVTNLTPHAGTQCAFVLSAGGWGYRHAFSMTDGDIVKIRCWFKFNSDGTAPDANIGVGKAVGKLVRNGDVLYPLIERMQGGNLVLDWMTAPVGQWIEFSMTIDYSVHKLLEVSLNGTATNFSDVFTENQTSPADSEMFISAYAGASHVYSANVLYDDIVFERIPRTGDGKLSVVPNTLTLGPGLNQAEVKIFNEGADQYNYSVNTWDMPAWMQLSKTSGSVVSSDVIHVTIDRAGMTDDFYRARIVIDAGSAGEQAVNFGIASGSVLYRCNYDDPYYEKGTELQSQDGWQEDLSNPLWFGSVLDDGTAPDGDDQCVYMECVNLYWHLIPAAGYDRLKISGWFNLATNTDVETLEFKFHTYLLVIGIKADKENNVCYLQLHDGTQIRDDAHAPLGEWVYASYTIDLSIHQVLEAEFATVKRRLNSVYINENLSGVDTVYLKAYNGLNTNSTCKVDDIRVEAVAASGTPLLSSVQYLGFSTNETSKTIPVVNMGAGSISYSVTTPDSEASWMQFSPQGGVFTDGVSITVTVNRAAVPDGYYRARLLIDGGEAGTSVVVVAMNAGDILYYSDFNERWYRMGELDGQDGWIKDMAPWRMDVTNFPGSDGQCAYIYHSGGPNGYYHPVEVPYQSTVKVGGTFYVPGDAGFWGFHMVTRDLQHQALAYQFWEDEQTGLVNLYLGQFYEHIELPPVKTNTWFDCYYIMDLKNKELLEVGFGDNAVILENEPLENGAMNFFNAIAIVCEQTNSITATKVCFDDIRIEVVPEPGLLVWGGLAGMLLALRNTRGKG